MLATVKAASRDAFLVVSDTVRAPFHPREPGPNGGILLVRLDGIGDLILWLPYARRLRETYSGAHLTLLAESSFAEYAAGLGLFSEVIPIARDRFARDLTYRYAMIRRVRLRAYDLAILPCYNRVGRFRDGEALMRSVRSDRKIASIGEDRNSWRDRISRRWYTELLPARQRDLHEIQRNMEFSAGLGIRVPEPATALHPLPLGYAHIQVSDPYFVLVPGAGSPLRKWPAANFARLADRLSRTTGWKGVLCGGPSDTPEAEEIRRLASVDLETCVGQASLEESVELIRHAEILIGNETGAVHIAAAVGTPSVAITGGGHFGRFVPYPPDTAGPIAASVRMPCFNCNWDCVYRLNGDEAAPCIKDISEDHVWSKITEILRTPVQRYDLKTADIHPTECAK